MHRPIGAIGVQDIQEITYIVRQPLRRVASLLLRALLAGHIDRQRRAPAPSSNGAATRRSAANAGSVVLTDELRSLNLF